VPEFDDGIVETLLPEVQDVVESIPERVAEEVPA
jgi:hypothetical protein